MKRVLITGAAGLIGGILRTGLDDNYRLSGLDQRRIRGFDARRVNMKRLRSALPVFEGADAVIDLAANSAMSAPWHDVHRNNIPATMTMLEAARQSGVQRVVFASSNHVTGLYERDPPYADVLSGRYEGLDPESIPRITSDFPIRPDGPYGLGKALGEAAARYYSDEFGLSVVCLRIGTVTAEGAPRNTRHFATLLTHGDLLRLVRSSLEAPLESGFGIFYGVSDNTWRIWDIEAAGDVIGYEPQDDAESWRRG